MSPSRSKELEAQANKLLRSAKAQRVLRRITSEPFDEKAGRAMYHSLPGRVALRPSFEGDSIVPAADIHGHAVADIPSPSDHGGADDVFRHVIFGGRISGGAILTRFLARAVKRNIITREEAARISGKSERTLRRELSA